MTRSLHFVLAIGLFLIIDESIANNYHKPHSSYNTAIKRKGEVHQTLIIDTIFPYKQSQKPVVSANYSLPGPMIEAFEGDTLVIRVINRLNVPTTVHWHGITQRGTPDMDGAVGLTQCAIPPGAEMVYRFIAEPAGTSWYHGHLLEQYTDGLYGPLIIHRRNESYTYKYDSERTLLVADWYNKLANPELISWYLSPDNPEGYEPIPDATIVNGKFTRSLFIPAGNSKRIRFRIINAAALSMYTVSIDGLPLHIIELDQNDTLPYSVSSFSINAAQRVSFLIDLDELHPIYSASGEMSTSSVFIRFQAAVSMYPVDVTNDVQSYQDQRYPYPVFFNPLYLAVLSLDSNNATPSYAANQPTPILKNAVVPVDSNILAARPLNSRKNKIPNPTHYLSVLIEFDLDAHGINRGYLNKVTYSSAANYMKMYPEPENGITSDEYAPLLHQMINNPYNLGIPSTQEKTKNNLKIIQTDGYGHYLIPYKAVVDLFLNNTDNGEHPFHLHGYKLWIIATSEYPEAESLYRRNYIQRDVVNVPAQGWAKVRFVADNPGPWFFHCHIDWHMSAGLMLTFLVSPQQLVRNGFKISQDQQNLCQALYDFNTKAKPHAP